MRTIPQVLIVLGLFCALVVYARFWRTRTSDRIIGIIAFGLAALGVTFPDSLTVVANHLGVGRGADLILYAFGTSSIFLFMVLYAKAARLEQHITSLARHIAISEAMRPEPREDPRAQGASTVTAAPAKPE